MADTYVIPRARRSSGYGHVIGSLGIWDDGEAALMLATIERALRETPQGATDRPRLEQWRAEIIRMRDRAHRENWRHWERQ